MCLVIGSLGVIAISTLTRRAGATSPGHLQLHPLGTLRQYLHDPADFLIYLGGNVAMFVPLGLFLYLAVRRGMLLCAALATLVSVGVEILQLPIYSRATDIDDVITNGFGGLVGAALGVVVLWAVNQDRVTVPDDERRTERIAAG
nr:VanZ family protein [Kineosporia mesophila]